MFLHPREAPGDILLFEGPCLSDPTSEGVLMLVHAKKLSLTAILALLGSALVASPAQGATSPVNCSGGGSFTVTTTFGSTFYGMDFSQGVRVEVSSSSSCTGMAPIPVNVNSIGPDAFSGSEGLTSVAYADGINLLYIGAKAFNGTKLSSVTIPGTVQKISVDAFLNTSLLTSVTFEGNAPEVAKEPPTTNFLAFSSAGSDPVGFISTLAGGFPDDPTWEGLTLSRATGMGGGGMGGGMTSPPVGCSGGGSFTVTTTSTAVTPTYPGGTIVEVDTSSNCTGIATIPMQVNSIGVDAFAASPALDSVVFADASSLQYIAEYAFFMHPSLTSITIPSSVSRISVNAFAHNPSLTSVTFDGNAPTVEPDPMDFMGLWLAFRGTNVNSVANIGAVATGFGNEPTWEGLTIVRASAAPAPYSGPTPTSYSDKTPSIGDEVTISGQRLEQVTSSTIDGVEVELSNKSSGGFTIVIPEGLEPGIKDLVLFGTFGKLTVQGAFTVEANPIQSSAVSSKTNAGVISRYVAVYAKGYKGKTLTWKIAGKWFETTITSDYQVFQRRTIAVGLDVFVHLYIDGEKQLTKKINTR